MSKILDSRQLVANRIFYGFGAVGITIFDSFIGSYLLLYATDVLGLDALFFSYLLIAPGILDILIGFFAVFLIGKVRTKFGMYRPWLLNMIGMVFALIVLFSVPFLNVSKAVMLIIVVVSYFICNSLCSSIYWITYKAIPGVITQNENELMHLASSKTIFEYFFSMVASASAMPILLTFGRYKGDYRNPTGWFAVALIFGTVSLVSSLLCFSFVRTDSELEKKMTKEHSVKEVLSDYKAVLSDKGFIIAVSLFFVIYLAAYISQTVSYYFFIYNLNLADIISYIFLIGAVFTLIASFLSVKLRKAIGVKFSFVTGAGSLIISAVCMMLSYSVVMVLIMGFFMVTGITILTSLIFSMWPVIAGRMNSDKIKAPLNSTIGVSSVCGNIGIILGRLIGSAVISYSRYNPDLAVQSAFTLNVFRYCSPILMIILSAVIIIFSRKIPE